MYGKQLILDLYECDAEKFTRKSIKEWLKQLCDLIDMTRADLHFWDYEDCPEEREKAPPHLAGITAIQFITTSGIVIHALDIGECYIDIFSCKDFDATVAEKFTKEWFGAGKSQSSIIFRGKDTKT